MVAEVLALVEPVPTGWFVDATVGGGGHAAAILTARPDLRLLGIDRDPAAVAAAAETLREFGTRAKVVQGEFDRVAEIVASGTTDAASGKGNEEIVGILFDLGVSSPQLDRPVRGFSYWADDAPLDMRMDSAQELTAETVLNEYSEADLAALIARNGEERFARRIAAEIVAARPLRTTGDLVAAVKRGDPRARAPSWWPPGAADVPGDPHGGQPRAPEPRGRPRRVGAPARPARARDRARLPLARGSHGQAALRRLVEHRGTRARAAWACHGRVATRSPGC